MRSSSSWPPVGADERVQSLDVVDVLVEVDGVDELVAVLDDESPLDVLDDVLALLDG